MVCDCSNSNKNFCTPPMQLNTCSIFVDNNDGLVLIIMCLELIQFDKETNPLDISDLLISFKPIIANFEQTFLNEFVISVLVKNGVM